MENKISMDKNINNINNSLMDTLVLFTKLYHKPYSIQSLISGLPISSSNNIDSFLLSKNHKESIFARAALRAGLKSLLVQKELKDILNLQLPMILILSNNNCCILDSFNQDKTQANIIFASKNDEASQWIDISELEKEYLGFGIMLKKEFEYDTINNKTLHIKQKHWLWNTLLLSKSIYWDVLLASLLINIFILATPLYTMNVYDRVIPNNAKETLYVFTLGVVIVYLLDSFLKFLRAYFLELAAKRTDIIISSIIFEKVIDLKLSSFPQSVGSFASNLKDFETIRSFITNSSLTILIDLPFSIIFLAVIYYIGGLVVFIPIVTICLIFLYAIIIKRPLKQSIESSYEASAKKNGILIESLQNIETIKSQNMSGNIQYKWEEATGEIATKNLKSRMLSASIPNITGLLTQLNTVFIVFFGVFLINNFELTMGGLIATVILTSRTIAPMGQAAALLTNYEDAKTSYNTLQDIMSKPIDRPYGKQFIQLDRIKGDIEFNNVTFTYPQGNKPALQNVSFKIKEGEKVAFIGKIGSGKSTITKLLLKLYEPQEGKILIDGIDISQIDPAQLRKSFGYLPQDIDLFRGTLKENIVCSNIFASDEQILKASKIANVDDFVKLDPLGYDMQIGERGQGLSGGQRQTVALARAFVTNSSYLLLDEPTNALDQNSENNIINSLKKHTKDKTLLIVTQKFTLLDLVDKVIVLNNAKIIANGDKTTVLSKLGNTNV
jgi:ATP-binding cassette subfamily C protein LapB